jgi:multidrug efflux pump subunit AcrB
MLIGWSVKCDYASRLYESEESGETIRTALIQANHARLRPILINYRNGV